MPCIKKIRVKGRLQPFCVLHRSDRGRSDRSCRLIGMVRPVALLLAATVLCTAAASVAGAEQQSVLVLLDDPALEQSHSTFLKSLSARGYAVTIKPITHKALQLKSWDDWIYDKLVILGSSNGELARALRRNQRR
jgi:hypothetical protein